MDTCRSADLDELHQPNRWVRGLRPLALPRGMGQLSCNEVTGSYPMRILENIISDRGSKYAVSGGVCRSSGEARAFIADLRRNKKFAKATHNTWALLCDEGALKNDDGEAGAGMVILRMLEREGIRDHIVVVTRWFGGKHLGGDRFRHVQEAVRIYFAEQSGGSR